MSMQIPRDSTISVQTKRDRSLLGVEQPRRTALAGRLEQRIGLPDDFRDARNRRHIAFELGRLLRLDQPHRRRRLRAVERSEERRVGNESFSTFSSRWLPSQYKKNTIIAKQK